MTDDAQADLCDYHLKDGQVVCKVCGIPYTEDNRPCEGVPNG